MAKFPKTGNRLVSKSGKWNRQAKPEPEPASKPEPEPASKTGNRPASKIGTGIGTGKQAETGREAKPETGGKQNRNRNRQAKPEIGTGKQYRKPAASKTKTGTGRQAKPEPELARKPEPTGKQNGTGYRTMLNTDGRKIGSCNKLK